MVNPLAYLLTLPYRAGLAVHNFKVQRIDAAAPGPFTICVGNLTAGGTGKTPFVIHLAEVLKKKHKVAVLTRGYGRKSKGLLALDGSRSVHPRECGDEPALIYQKLDAEVPVLVSKDRVETARLARERYNCDAVILDDGFQHRKLLKHLSILLLDHRDLVRGERLPPLGLWREPLRAAERADVLVLNFKDEEPRNAVLPDFLRSKPVHRMRYRLGGFRDSKGRRAPLDEIKGRPVIGVSGIADPRSFHRALRRANLHVRGFKRFLDHHWFSSSDLEGIERIRKDSSAELVITTEKDLIRIEDPPEHYLALCIKVDIENEDELLGTVELGLSLHKGESKGAHGQEDHVG
jgi:tetraacyldisaccharide 4'-kinase